MIAIPKEIDEVLDTLQIHNYEAYVVGGAIRDFIMGYTPKDFDICTNASIEDMLLIFRDYKIIETGLKRGTITLLINSWNIEITTFRGLDKNLKSDLICRDFTMNALAYSKQTGVIDCCSSINDIKNKVIRINGNDDSCFKEDPLRILRAIRFDCEYGFNIESRTKKYMFNNKELLNNVAKERIKTEFSKIIVTNKFMRCFKEYFDIIVVFIPELKKLKGFKQYNDYHIYDCLEHTYKVMENVSDDLLIRLVALFHDIAKPDCFMIDDKGIGHFYGHEKKGAEMVNEVLKRLKYDRAIIKQVSILIFFHNYPLPKNRKSARKFLNLFGTNNLDYWYEIKRADLLGKNPKYHIQLEEIDRARYIIEEVIKDKDCFSLKDLNINGNDLIENHIANDKNIGIILNQLLGEVIGGIIINNKEVLLKRSKEISGSINK